MNYKQIKDAVFAAKSKPDALADLLYSIPNLQDLLGVVTISGTVQVGVQLTAVTTGITNNTGTLKYQWKIDGVDIEAATNSTYTPVVGDATKTLSVVVTSSIQQSSLTANGGVVAAA